MTYPVGHEISADEYTRLVTLATDLVAVKSTTQTVNNTTVFVNDAELFALVEANAVYHFELCLRYNTLAASDLKTQWSVPAGALMIFDVLGIKIGATALTLTSWDSNSDFGFEGQGGVAAARETGIIRTGANAGTVQFRWSQNTVNASDTQITGDSYLIVRKLS